MKRILIIFSLMIAVVAAYGQRSAIYGVTEQLTINGTSSDTTILPSWLFQEYDFSYQVIPTAYGAGDSLNAVVELFQTNDMDGTAYTEITSAQDTVTAAVGKLIEGTNATGLKHKLIITGISTDTITAYVYWVLKLDRYF